MPDPGPEKNPVTNLICFWNRIQHTVRFWYTKGIILVQKQSFRTQNKRTNYPVVLRQVFAVLSDGKPRLFIFGLLGLARIWQPFFCGMFSKNRN